MHLFLLQSGSPCAVIYSTGWRVRLYCRFCTVPQPHICSQWVIPYLLNETTTARRSLNVRQLVETSRPSHRRDCLLSARLTAKSKVRIERKNGTSPFFNSRCYHNAVRSGQRPAEAATRNGSSTKATSPPSNLASPGCKLNSGETVYGLRQV
jgi:hypothetical protein